MAEAREAKWQAHLRALQEFVAANPSSPPPASSSLVGWISRQRAEYKARHAGQASTLTPERIAALEAVPGFSWAAPQPEAVGRGAPAAGGGAAGGPAEKWQARLEELQQYVAKHGDLPPARSSLGGWVSRQRKEHKDGALGPENAAALEGVPLWAWEVDPEARWQERLEEVRQYAAAHGGVPKPRAGLLGRWLSAQRLAYSALQQGRPTHIPPERVAALEAVPGFVWDLPVDPDAKWQAQLEELIAGFADLVGDLSGGEVADFFGGHGVASFGLLRRRSPRGR